MVYLLDRRVFESRRNSCAAQAMRWIRVANLSEIEMELTACLDCTLGPERISHCTPNPTIRVPAFHEEIARQIRAENLGPTWAKTRAFWAAIWGSREAKATDSTGLLVGAVGIERSVPNAPSH